MFFDHLLLEFLAFMSTDDLTVEELPEDDLIIGFIKNHKRVTESFGVAWRIFSNQNSEDFSNYCLGINYGY